MTNSVQRLPEFVNILCGLGKIVGEFDFRFAQLAQFVDGELETVFVFVDKAFDLEKIVLLENVENLIHIVPHLGFELPTAVAESEGEIRFPGLLRLDLLSHHHEIRGDDLVFVAGAIADVKLLHAAHQCKSETRTRCVGERKPNPKPPATLNRSAF